jgi:hypothetical protein
MNAYAHFFLCSPDDEARLIIEMAKHRMMADTTSQRLLLFSMAMRCHENVMGSVMDRMDLVMVGMGLDRKQAHSIK